jgi:uncharacterized protein YndB with AHSA1/START domain
VRLQASAELLSPPEDVWKLVSEPYHLSDWWPGYRGIQLDRLAFAEGARWRVNRGPTGAGTSNLIRRPGGEGILVVRRIVEGSLFAWHDVELGVDCAVVLEPAGGRRTSARASIDGPWLRITLEGLRTVPRQAVRRLHDLCQTAAEL